MCVWCVLLLLIQSCVWERSACRYVCLYVSPLVVHLSFSHLCCFNWLHSPARVSFLYFLAQQLPARWIFAWLCFSLCLCVSLCSAVRTLPVSSPDQKMSVFHAATATLFTSLGSMKLKKYLHTSHLISFLCYQKQMIRIILICRMQIVKWTKTFPFCQFFSSLT